VNFELLCGKCTELVELQSASADSPVFQAKRHIFQGLLDAQIEEVPAPCAVATAYSFRRAGALMSVGVRRSRLSMPLPPFSKCCLGIPQQDVSVCCTNCPSLPPWHRLTC